jgi:DnaJ-class molecular chaperone
VHRNVRAQLAPDQAAETRERQHSADHDLSRLPRRRILHRQTLPRLRRHGANLRRRHSLKVVDAVLGSKVTVPALDGEVEVDVPAGTQPESILRLKDKGVPHFGSDTRGDLSLRIDVHVLETQSRAHPGSWRSRADQRSPRQ